MASLRPASRVLGRRLIHPTTSSIRACTQQQSLLCRLPTLTSSTTLRNHQQSHQFHTTSPLPRESVNPRGPSGRPEGTTASNADAPQNISKIHRVPPTDPESNDAYPDGAPGEPKAGESLPSGIPLSKIYTFEDISSIAHAPDSYPHKIIVDVREPGELLDTGRVPGAVNVPIKTAPDAFFMSAEDFEDKFGFARPGDEDEVIFYCKAGVRSKAAARLAGQAGWGGKYGEFPGSFDEYLAKGGTVQRE